MDSSRARNDFKPLPQWLRRPPGSHAGAAEVKRLLRGSGLNTVCEEARCPNIAECFSRGTATFMILGSICTRGCRFCAVTTGRPLMPEGSFVDEAERVADAAATMGLKYVVVTSVARDDLSDGGASGFAATVKALRRRLPAAGVELLIPDLRGNWSALETILDAAPDVLNHNLETVPRLYRKVRPGASYFQSLELLRLAKSLRSTVITKTGLMLGLGESEQEVTELIHAARDCGVDIFTAGQYLQPSRHHLPVVKYLELHQFDAIRSAAYAAGFQEVAVGPLVRSSYHAEELSTNLSHSAPFGH